MASEISERSPQRAEHEKPVFMRFSQKYFGFGSDSEPFPVICPDRGSEMEPHLLFIEVRGANLEPNGIKMELSEKLRSLRGIKMMPF